VLKHKREREMAFEFSQFSLSVQCDDGCKETNCSVAALRSECTRFHRASTFDAASVSKKAHKHSCSGLH
jgi:hypothetical protein